MDIFNAKINRSNLLFRLSCLARRWRKLLDAEFQVSGLTDATWRPMLHLYHLGDDVRQKDLAASLGIEGPSLVRLIDTLMAKGLIERSEDARDRRAKLLRLTPAGQELVSRIWQTVTELEEGIFSQFNDEELAGLAGLIQRLESSVVNTRKRSRP